jgi:hypothetical protein
VGEKIGGWGWVRGSKLQLLYVIPKGSKCIQKPLFTGEGKQTSFVVCNSKR